MSGFRGKLRYYNIIKDKRHIGETNVMSDGSKPRIVSFSGPRDIDVVFEDGTFVRHVSYTAFTEGKLTNPNCQMESS